MAKPRDVASRPKPVSVATAEPLPKAESPRLVSFKAEDDELRDVIDIIARQAGVNIVVEPQIHEKVTLTLREVPWLEAVQLIAQMTKCEVNVFRDGVYYVIDPPKVTIH